MAYRLSDSSVVHLGTRLEEWLLQTLFLSSFGTCAAVKFPRSVNEWLMDSSVLRKLWPWFQHDISGCMGAFETTSPP